MASQFTHRVLGLGILILSAGFQTVSGQSRLEPIGVLPGGFTSSAALDISANGKFVVGSSSDSNYATRAFRWSLTGGIEALPWLTPGVDEHSVAYAVSADGSVIVGRVAQAGGFSSTAVRWVNGVPSPIPPLGPEHSTVYAVDVSWDGSVVAGYSEGCGFVWTAKAGTQPIPIPPGFSSCCEARAISGDGTTIVGLCNNVVGYIWSEITGPQALNYPGAPQTAAQDVSDDGQVVVGNWAGPSGTRAFRWTPIAGFEDLGEVADQSGPVDVKGCSADGSVVVGDYYAFDLHPYVFVWSEAHGMRRLNDLVPNAGGYPGSCGWYVGNSNAVSADGTRVVGHASYPGTPFGAYVAYLEDAPTDCCNGCDDADPNTSDACVDGICAHTPILYGDVYPCGGDGIIDVDDILTVLAAFQGQNPCPNQP